MTDERHDTAFVVGAVLGGLLGGAYTLFTAPQSGAQTRSELVARWNALTGGVASKAATLDGEVRQLVSSAEAAVSPLAERLHRDRADTAVAAEAVEVEVATAETEPVFTLPDPLEPGPVARDKSLGAGAGGEDQPGAAASATVGELDVVVEGPRPADTQR